MHFGYKKKKVVLHCFWPLVLWVSVTEWVGSDIGVYFRSDHIKISLLLCMCMCSYGINNCFGCMLLNLFVDKKKCLKDKNTLWFYSFQGLLPVPAPCGVLSGEPPPDTQRVGGGGRSSGQRYVAVTSLVPGCEYSFMPHVFPCHFKTQHKPEGFISTRRTP